MHPEFPEDVRRFILERINSLASLEMLLLLRNTAGKEWTPAQVARELATSDASASERLAELAGFGLVARIEIPTEPASKGDESGAARMVVQYRYQPASTQVDRLVGELQRLYRERRVTVIEIIFSRPLDKIRTFADAFKIRKE